MSESSICLKSVNQLLIDEDGQPMRFWIPAYQRGYRWTPLQVTQLLDDVWEFVQNSEGGSGEAFYCLQPIVVKQRKEGDYEVVDGQQRLTTIYILLTCLKEMVEMLGKKRFLIRFETRGEANEPFLENIDLDRAEENVDFYYICEAYRAIESWFADRDAMHKLKLLQHFLNDDEAGRNVKVIWFRIGDSENPIDAFTRLNVGKIPLTNDELIRALFLKSSSVNDRDAEATQLRIAYEWDQLEKALQADEFWFFLNDQQGQQQNRIAFLFKLVARSEGMLNGLERDAYGVFYAYSKKLKEDGFSPEEEWLRVKQAFMMLEEWFEDRTLFHVVGYLIHQGVAVEELRKLSVQTTKKHFEKKLRACVFNHAIGGGSLDQLDTDTLQERVKDRLENLEYGTNSNEIRSILLLFNLATLLEDPRSNIRFQFDSFKKGEWDIEHVRSVAVRRPIRHHERLNWLDHCLGYLKTQDKEQDLCDEIQAFMALAQNEADDELFAKLYKKALSAFKESDDEDVDDGISNLTLLDSSTNRSYKNAVFAVKRQRLLELDRSGIFVPLCTRNVFLKCYSERADNVMFWSEQDRVDYINTMIETLVNFFNGQQRLGA